MDKNSLISSLELGRERFLELFDDFNDEAMLLPEPSSDWSMKEILSHLTRWEAELVKLLWQLSQGQKPSTVHFSNASVDEINARWLQEDRARPLERVITDYHGVRDQTIRRVEPFSDHDLTDENRFPSLKGRPLWEWIADDSYEHEIEHTPQVQAIRLEWRKKMGNVS